MPSIGSRGGILLAWDRLVVSASNRHVTENTLTTLVKQDGEAMWWLTGVYGPQSDVENGEFLQELREVRDLQV